MDRAWPSTASTTGLAQAMNSSILEGITVRNTSASRSVTMQASEAPINVGTKALGWPGKNRRLVRPMSLAWRSNAALSAPSPTSISRALGRRSCNSCAASRIVPRPWASPNVPTYAAMNWSWGSPRASRHWRTSMGLKRSVSTPFSTTSILSGARPRPSMSFFRWAGATVTTWSAALYRNRATASSPRATGERSLPIPTAARDSGQRSRTSNTKGVRCVRLIHHPAVPTSSCGDVAMVMSGLRMKTPRRAAEAAKET